MSDMYYEDSSFVIVEKEKARSIQKYFYKYYSCADFLGIMSGEKRTKFIYFKDVNRDVMFNQRLLEQVVSNPKTKQERMQRYQNYFPEKLARLNNGDGTFCFVLPSGKVVPDKFFAFTAGNEMRPEVSNFEAIQLKQEVFGTGKATNVTKNGVGIVNFYNQFGIYLLDISKIRSMSDVLAILAVNPQYLHQIPANFFKKSNISAIRKQIESYYKTYLQQNHAFYYVQHVQELMTDLDGIIFDKSKLCEKLEQKRLQEKIENEQKICYRTSKDVEYEKQKYSEQFKKQSFPTLYKYYELLDQKYNQQMRGKDNLQKMYLREELYEKKMEIAEKYRESLYSKRRYIPTNLDPLNKYVDNLELCNQLEENNTKLEEKIRLLDIAVIQSLNNKLCNYQTKISDALSFDGEEIAQTVQGFLKKSDPNTIWKTATIYVPDISNVQPVYRMGRFVNVEHSSLRYTAVISKNYPKSLQVISVDNQDDANKLLKRIERQIKNKNLVVISEQNKRCDLSKNISDNELSNGTKLPTISILKNSSYAHFDGVEDALLSKVIESLKPVKKSKKKDVQKDMEA